MKLRPFNKNIIIQFLDETSGDRGRFTERTSLSIIIPVSNSGQSSTHRWAKVVAVGPDVQNVKEGDFALIRSLAWLPHEMFEGEKVWRTDDDQVLAVTNDEKETLLY